MKYLLIFFLLLQTQLLWARSFEKVKIPGAKCGDGSDYSVFLSKLSDEKLLIEFMGGGACWDRASCFELPKTWIRPIPNINVFSVLTSSNKDLSPYTEHSILFLPYCTGDVHVGNHIGYYDGKKVFHYGRRNLDITLKYLEENKIVTFKNYNDVTIWGASAGAIAALVHGKTIEPHLSEGTKKTLIVDSPGLHFGAHFMDKFPKETQQDFDESFRGVGLAVDFHDGFVAKKMRPTLEMYQDWNVGFLFGSKDIVMSEIFGNISPSEEEKLILGPDGIPALARSFPNVKVWLKNTYMHTFLLTKPSALMESNDGQTAVEFVKELNDTP